MHFTNGSGRIHYDQLGKRRRITYIARNDYFRPKNLEWVDDLQVALPDGRAASNLTHGGVDDGLAVCTPNLGVVAGAMYQDMFAWVLQASRSGSKVVRGERCDIFTLSVTAPFPADFWACVGEDGLPREMNQSVNRRVFGGYRWYRFSNFRVGRPEEGWVFPAVER